MVWVFAVLILGSVCYLEGVSAQVSINKIPQTNRIVDHSVQLLESSLLFGVLNEFVSDGSANSRCNNEVQIILDGIRMRKIWALKSNSVKKII